MQFSNYGTGTTCTVNLFVDGVLVLTYSGSVNAGVANLDCVALGGSYVSGINMVQLSEFCVSADDTRAFPGVQTLALTSDGTTHNWTGAYSTINGTTISDASPNYVNTDDQLQEANVTDPPAGVYVVTGILINARMAKSATSTPTQAALGYNDGGAVTVGADIALTTGYAHYEQLFTASLPPLANIAALQILAKSRA